jgi:hypothetical protein
MTSWSGTRSPAIAAIVGIALSLLAVACGQSSPTANVTTPSAASSRPQGGPVPTTLLGDWFLPPAIVVAVENNNSCRLLRLTLATTTYRLSHDAACGALVIG